MAILMAILRLLGFGIVAAPLTFFVVGLAIVAWTTTPRPRTRTLVTTTAVALGVVLGTLIVGVRLFLRVIRGHPHAA